LARLLERDAALATLHRLREEAAEDAGRLVLVEGEAGIGKTSLLGAFRASLPDGVTALVGACDPLSTPRPLGPIVDVAADLDPAFARLLADGAARDTTLQALLGAVRRRGPGIVLLLDDLHWADEATLDALRFVGRRVDTTRTLVVGAYRDDEVGPEHPLRVLVGDLATSAAVRRLPLAALSAASVRELAEGTGIDPDELLRTTGGNPFFVTEVIAGAPARVPPTVRDAVLARAARLSPPARRTLEAAAVIGPTIEPGLLIRVVEPIAADECLASGLLVTRDGRYAFRHELAREAVLGATDPTVQIGLHRHILAALEAQPGDGASLAVLAHHADRAGDEAQVLRYAPAAAREAAAASAHREAAAHLARAVRAAGGLPDAERAELLSAHGDAQAAIGRADIALSAYAEEVAIWHRLGQPVRAGHAMCGLADAYIGVGRNEDAEVASREALDLTSAAPRGPEHAQALMTQAYLRMLDRDNEEAIALGRQVIAGDPAVLQPATIGSAWNLVGSARILLDDLAGRDDLLEGLRIFEGAGIAWGVRSCYGNLGSAFGEMYRFSDAEPYLEAGIRYAEDHDVDASYVAAWEAVILMHRGNWAGAESQALVVAHDRHVPALSRIMALYALGRLKTRRGDTDAGVVLDEALAVAAPTGTLQRIGPVRAARAEAAWLAGDPQRAAD
jgi:predicted ATPase